VKRGRSDDVRRGRVQPAGTPAIRLACLAAWEATSDGQILDPRWPHGGSAAAQLVSAGWYDW